LSDFSFEVSEVCDLVYDVMKHKLRRFNNDEACSYIFRLGFNQDLLKNCVSHLLIDKSNIIEGLAVISGKSPAGIL